MNEYRKKLMDSMCDILECWQGCVHWDAVLVAKDILDFIEGRKDGVRYLRSENEIIKEN